MERTPFAVDTGSGELSGWVSGAGPRVLAIHGGPGMSFEYVDDAVAELAARYQVVTYQQRGLAPSTEQGEFTVAEAVADIAAVLDGLGWDTAYLVGHSWGGHLVFHAAVGITERIAGGFVGRPARRGRGRRGRGVRGRDARASARGLP